MKRKILTIGVLTGFLLAAGFVSGCSKDSPSSSNSGTPLVNMAVSFSKSGASSLSKGYSVDGLTDVRIDSAVVVIDRIKFESDMDTSTLMINEHPMDDAQDNNYTFKGPFVIHVRDTIGINFASADLPAGTYNGVKFKIHNLIAGEPREDSDVRNHHRFILGDTAIAGSSITVWGVVVKNGVSTKFTYNFNGEVEFKIKGSYVVPAAGSAVNFALNFNISAFFVDTKTGALLDPTDTSNANKVLIRQAIYSAFGAGRCGHDRGDGHPRD
jgi:hypothetical protein